MNLKQVAFWRSEHGAYMDGATVTTMKLVNGGPRTRNRLGFGTDSSLEQNRKNNKLKGGQDSIQEVVAELGSCVLMEIFGKDTENKYKSWTYDYIKSYTMNKNGQPKTNEEIAQFCIKVFGRIEKAFDEIFKTLDELKNQKALPLIEVRSK